MYSLTLLLGLLTSLCRNYTIPLLPSGQSSSSLLGSILKEKVPTGIDISHVTRCTNSP
jgi:hypothetical protein